MSNAIVELPFGAVSTLEDAERALESPEDFAAVLATIAVAESAEQLFAIPVEPGPATKLR